MQANCYSQRMLNPFRGIMNIVEVGYADAISTDGIHWDLYIRDEGNIETVDNDGHSSVETFDLRFGKWSEKSGLKRAPLLPTMDLDTIRFAGEQLLATIENQYKNVPFPMADCYELWMLDKYTNRPLALLDSSPKDVTLTHDVVAEWRAGQLCKTGFRSENCQAACNHAEILGQRVNDAVGDPVRAQWFLRDEAGNGASLDGINIDDELLDRTLPAEAFPELLLQSTWLDNNTTALIADFHAWQAPWLLLLQHLSDNTREQLEKSACKQATLVASLHRLYPKLINPDVIRAALVEAALRTSVQDNQISEHASMSVDYIEL